jgi:casein kinase I homolog HRR25
MDANVRWLVGGKYQITKLIGTGSFGTFWTFLAFITTFSNYSSGSTFASYDVFSGEGVALNLEPQSSLYFYLENECTIYHYLGPKCPGIPQLRWSGTECDYSVVVLSLLRPSLESLFSHDKHCFTLQVVATIAEQLVHWFFQFVSIY